MGRSWGWSNRRPWIAVAGSFATDSRTCSTPRRPTWRKRGRGRTCPCGGSRKSHGPEKRRLLTAAGDVTLRRREFTCRRCGARAYALDERLGVDGFVSPGAQRLLCLLGAERSFERSARLLREVAGLCVCDNTIRQICDQHGGRMRAWQREQADASQTFRAAQGRLSFRPTGRPSTPPAAGVRSA